MKVITSLVIIFLIQFASSCVYVCKDFKYYDFDEMEVNLSTTLVGLQDSLIIDISPLDIEFLGINTQGCGFASGFSQKCDKGWEV